MTPSLTLPLTPTLTLPLTPTLTLPSTLALTLTPNPHQVRDLPQAARAYPQPRLPRCRHLAATEAHLGGWGENYGRGENYGAHPPTF